jgi:hypothetical protein
VLQKRLHLKAYKLSVVQHLEQSGHKNSKQIIWKCVTVQIFEDDSNKSKFDSGEIKRRLNYGKACYHSVQNLVLSSAVEKRKNYKIEDYNFACGSVWVCNLVSDIKGGT